MLTFVCSKHFPDFDNIGVSYYVLFSGVYVKDLLSFVTKSVKEIEHVMNVGNQNRSVGATNMNEHRLVSFLPLG